MWLPQTKNSLPTTIFSGAILVLESVFKITGWTLHYFHLFSIKCRKITYNSPSFSVSRGTLSSWKVSPSVMGGPRLMVCLLRSGPSLVHVPPLRSILPGRWKHKQPNIRNRYKAMVVHHKQELRLKNQGGSLIWHLLQFQDGWALLLECNIHI